MDTSIFFSLHSLAGRSAVMDGVIIFLATYLPYVLIVAFVGVLYFSIYPKKEKIYIFAVAFASAIVARFGVVDIIRYFYHRPRPFLAFHFQSLISENSWSFPSGHSAFFFALAAAIFFYNKKWGIGFFIAAIFMNLSRIAAGVHYPSDILGGMVVGIAVAYIIFRVAEMRQSK